MPGSRAGMGSMGLTDGCLTLFMSVLVLWSLTCFSERDYSGEQALFLAACERGPYVGTSALKPWSQVCCTRHAHIWVFWIWLFSPSFLLSFLLFFLPSPKDLFLHCFSEGEEGGETSMWKRASMGCLPYVLRAGVVHAPGLDTVHSRTRDPTHNLGMCPDHWPLAGNQTHNLSVTGWHSHRATPARAGFYISPVFLEQRRNLFFGYEEFCALSLAALQRACLFLVLLIGIFCSVFKSC